MNGYICTYKNKQIEVYADSTYQAQCKAALVFKPKEQYEIDVYLCELNSQQVQHMADF